MFQNKRFKPYLLILGIAAILIGTFALSSIAAQGQPVFRIGVLDSPDGSLTRGAQLAIEEINNAGGVVGADGTVFQLQLVIQPTTDLPTAVANINQASVIAVIGPESSQTILGNRSLLASLNVPLLTPATDDTIVVSDASKRILRIRAQESLQGRALADYLINDLNAASFVTVQLDLESTVSVIGFTRAASQLGLIAGEGLLLQEGVSIDNLVAQIIRQMPQFVVAYGPPELTAQLYTTLRQSDWPGRFVYNRANSVIFRNGVQESLLEGIIGVSSWSYTVGDESSQNFVFAYIRAFGNVPNELDAAAYDTVYLLQKAIGRPGALQDNLLAISNFEGVQGTLNPALLASGETSNNVVVTELGTFGAPLAVVRFVGGQRVPLESSDFVRETPTPRPTATPEGVYLEITRAVQNVRTGPGLNYNILGQLQEGETARVIGANIDFTWVVIAFRGQNGWLSRGILDVIGDRNTIPVIAAPPSPIPPPTATLPPVTATPPLPQLPDIVISSASPPRLTIGSSFNVNVTVTNAGASAAGPFAVAVTFEPGGVFSAINLPGLGANTSTNITLTGVLAGATGSQTVTIVADLNQQVAEGNGENNNFAYQFSYVADALLLTTAPATGTLTLNELGTIAFDGSGDDIQWGGGGIAPLGSTRLVLLNNFSSLASVHRDAIASANLQNLPIGNVQAGMLIGFLSDSGAKHGVIEVISANPGVSITFNYRTYDS
ncbi:MAG: ABC transporter substrate-binding protein [Anaerolineae bacterium]|nr:ABC transporter substrate-binding protein [Anaerolineae bacterium]